MIQGKWKSGAPRSVSSTQKSASSGAPAGPTQGLAQEVFEQSKTNPSNLNKKSTTTRTSAASVAAAVPVKKKPISFAAALGSGLPTPTTPTRTASAPPELDHKRQPRTQRSSGLKPTDGRDASVTQPQTAPPAAVQPGTRPHNGAKKGQRNGEHRGNKKSFNNRNGNNYNK